MGVSNYKKADVSVKISYLKKMRKSTTPNTQSYQNQFRMKYLPSLVAISTLSNIGVAQLLGLPLPIFNPFDPKFNEWQPAGPDDCK